MNTYTSSVHLIESVYAEIESTLTELFTDWPLQGTVARASEIWKHVNHPITMTFHGDTLGVDMYCNQCEVKLLLNHGKTL